jgi:hypothetical protein
MTSMLALLKRVVEGLVLLVPVDVPDASVPGAVLNPSIHTHSKYSTKYSTLPAPTPAVHLAANVTSYVTHPSSPFTEAAI